MGLTDSDLQRRRADLTARERDVAAREHELEARRSWRRLWWALRLAPWGIAELTLVTWLIVAGTLLGDAMLRFTSIVSALVFGLLAIIRLCGATAPPPDGR